MKVETTRLDGLLVLKPEPLTDERGFFARTWDRDELLTRDLPSDIVQSSIAFTNRFSCGR